MLSKLKFLDEIFATKNHRFSQVVLKFFLNDSTKNQITLSTNLNDIGHLTVRKIGNEIHPKNIINFWHTTLRIV